ncbi:MAG: hypothetical protein A2W80_16810 [Candidatus Riflebacteria bacterium GWC2_50_8]|nr:MAG: hypothetical protein A2W80_16810 [Candidatus Riflebacteria bacterium GWC2_50_8]
MDSLPENEIGSKIAEDQVSAGSASGGRSLFWVIFTFAAIQTFLALLINISRSGGLFFMLPVVSLIFCVITIDTALAAITSVSYKALAILFTILAYLLATGFFFITAIFVGGLGG